ncbi:MAG: hypothetical protein QOH61_2207 [Chloroflexota bacterium]|nr:hypothetical protein [Chloroflexota bacterium]
MALTVLGGGAGTAGAAAPTGTASSARAAQRPAATAAKVTVGKAILTDYVQPVLFIVRGTGRATRGYVVEQSGRIHLARFDPDSKEWRKAGVFLDIRTLVTRSGDPGEYEGGLLGMAFAPDYKTSGKFYVDYTAHADGATIVAEYRRKTADRANPASARRVLRVASPYRGHNGGTLAFKDGLLYISIGDGGNFGDPGDRAQDLGSRRGKILRIDPADPDGTGPKTYTVPADNPFVEQAGAWPEIWAYGLRNPWRFSIDPPTGDLWIGDVGQCQYEEIDHDGDARGLNFGWNLVEGTHLFDKAHPCDPEPECVTDCQTLPVVEYPHGPPCSSVNGGYVYRGGAYPAWQGHYVYSDFCSGQIWTIPASGPPGTPLEVTPARTLMLTSFGTDTQGELYAVTWQGQVFKLKLNGDPSAP